MRSHVAQVAFKKGAKRLKKQFPEMFLAQVQQCLAIAFGYSDLRDLQKANWDVDYDKTQDQPGDPWLRHVTDDEIRRFARAAGLDERSCLAGFRVVFSNSSGAAEGEFNPIPEFSDADEEHPASGGESKVRALRADRRPSEKAEPLVTWRRSKRLDR